MCVAYTHYHSTRQVLQSFQFLAEESQVEKSFPKFTQLVSSRVQIQAVRAQHLELWTTMLRRTEQHIIDTMILKAIVHLVSYLNLTACEVSRRRSLASLYRWSNWSSDMKPSYYDSLKYRGRVCICKLRVWHKVDTSGFNESLAPYATADERHRCT